MKTFLWVVIVLCVLSCIGKLIMLTTGKFPPRNPKHEAWDVVSNTALIVWAAVLLSMLN